MTRRQQLLISITLFGLLASTACNSSRPDTDVIIGVDKCGFTLVAGPVKHPDPEDSKPDWKELRKDLSRAVDVTNEFWSKHWQECFANEYEEPAVLGYFEEGSEPTCAGKPLDPYNAGYCNPEKWVAWGKPLIELGEEDGDALAYLVVAHEIGHAVQAQLPDNYRAADRSEQQADCFAGAALAAENFETKFEWEVGDDNEAALSLIRLSDKTPWTKVEKGQSARHGDALERIYAFQDGRINGVRACFDIL